MPDSYCYQRSRGRKCSETRENFLGQGFFLWVSSFHSCQGSLLESTSVWWRPRQYPFLNSKCVWRFISQFVIPWVTLRWSSQNVSVLSYRILFLSTQTPSLKITSHNVWEPMTKSCVILETSFCFKINKPHCTRTDS